MNVIELENVNFGYKKGIDILCGLSMNIPKGSIYGFLGPNGAGKTTTLKLILSLLHNSTGEIKILNEQITNSYPQYLSKIGSLVENSSLYEHLSAKDNLRLWAKHFPHVYLRIDELLKTVGLNNEGQKKTSAYSTGMKQRLGLAIALLHNPEILILDEPTNGLDPFAITTLRKILFQLRDEGKTILLSSHILSEVEKVVSHVGILKEGRLAFEGPINDLYAVIQKNIELTLKVDDLEKAKKILSEQYDVRLIENALNFTIKNQIEINSIIKKCIQNDIMIFEVFKQKGDLEKLFINISNSKA